MDKSKMNMITIYQHDREDGCDEWTVSGPDDNWDDLSTESEQEANDEAEMRAFETGANIVRL